MDDRSESYEVLEKRINEIISNFYFEQEPTSMPTPKEQDMVRAMIVLCHAEFEDYIEQIARNLLEKGKEEWLSSNIANKNLAALFLETKPIETNDSIETKAMKVISDYKHNIDGNHGIKQKDLKKLYKPLGYDMEIFDQAFLNELDSLGSQRGEVAHSSSSRTKKILDFNTEKEKIVRILNEIREFQDTL
ncbi:HEPN domain-containing protein [Anaerovibrio sp. JC8]|uniref:HEPN domain-containing protein n=1 Tax=Anaerovibrio sp. JC8 TaxID=1240085 RepID=UPI000A111B68|nr:HEPN domain-containing protein [Anaerovibrio sp. JC8]